MKSYTWIEWIYFLLCLKSDLCIHILTSYSYMYILDNWYIASVDMARRPRLTYWPQRFVDCVRGSSIRTVLAGNLDTPDLWTELRHLTLSWHEFSIDLAVGMDENNFDVFCWVCWNICGRCGSWLLDSTWSGYKSPWTMSHKNISISDGRFPWYPLVNVYIAIEAMAQSK